MNTNNVNYSREMEAVVASLGNRRPRLLLHSCCGPCSSAVLETVAEHFDTALYYYNPNILPAAEYDKRLYWLRRLLERAPFARGVELIVPDRDEEAFWAAARGLEGEPEGGARCTACFELRLGATARAAGERGFEYFCTTLTVSPHKNAPLINAIGAGGALAALGLQEKGRLPPEHPAQRRVRPLPPGLVRLRPGTRGLRRLQSPPRRHEYRKKNKFIDKTPCFKV